MGIDRILRYLRAITDRLAASHWINVSIAPSVRGVVKPVSSLLYAFIVPEWIPVNKILAKEYV